MIVSKNSGHFWLYRMTYDGWQNDGMPTNLCPYFWKLVAALLFLPFNLFFQAFSFIWNPFISEWDREMAKKYSGSRRENGVKNIVTWFIVLTYFIGTYHWGKAVADYFSSDYWNYSPVFANIGLAFNSIIGCIILVIIIVKLIEAKADRDWAKQQSPGYKPKEKKPNIIWEFIKASYHNYCPRLDWEQKE